eukprot:1791585-Alexandrium_andersonii.AAC.1
MVTASGSARPRPCCSVRTRQRVRPCVGPSGSSNPSWRGRSVVRAARSQQRSAALRQRPAPDDQAGAGR